MIGRTIHLAAGLGLLLLAGQSVADSDGEGTDEADAEPTKREENAVIHFADLNGIENWRPAEGGEALLIEGRNERWYKATFHTRCVGLPYANALGFVTDATGSLDRFGSVLVDGMQCRFRALERTEAPED